MGTQPSTGITGALFTPVQRRVLGLLFGQPDRRFQSAELIRLADSGTGAVHRQLLRLANAGLLTVTRQGNQKYYQADRTASVFHELHGLIIKTVGLVDPPRDTLAPLGDQIEAARCFAQDDNGYDYSPPPPPRPPPTCVPIWYSFGGSTPSSQRVK